MPQVYPPKYPREIVDPRHLPLPSCVPAPQRRPGELRLVQTRQARTRRSSGSAWLAPLSILSDPHTGSTVIMVTKRSDRWPEFVSRFADGPTLCNFVKLPGLENLLD